MIANQRDFAPQRRHDHPAGFVVRVTFHKSYLLTGIVPKAAPEDVRCWQEDAMNLSEHTFEEDPIDPYYSEPPAQTDL